MKQLLKAVRWILATLLLILLFVTVFITPITTSVTTLLTNRANILRWIDGSGLYTQTDKITLLVLNFSQNTDNESEHPEEQSKIKEVLNDVLTPGFTKDFIEGGINSAYDYLEGKTTKIQVKMDERNLEDAIVKVFDNFSDTNLTTVEDLKKLPTCTPQEALQLEQAASIEEIELTCIPATIDLDNITQDILKQFGVKQQSEAGTIVQLVPTQFEFTSTQAIALKSGYNIVKITPLILAAMIISITLLAALLVPTAARVTIPAIVGISASCFALTFSLLLFLSKSVATFAFSLIKIPYLTDFSGLQFFVETVIKDISQRSIWISTGILVAYVLLLLMQKFLKTKATSK